MEIYSLIQIIMVMENKMRDIHLFDPEIQIKTIKEAAGVMKQCPIAITSLAQYLSLVSSNHTMAHNCL